MAKQKKFDQMSYDEQSEWLLSGGDRALQMGTGPMSDRYITAVDSAGEAWAKTDAGKASRQGSQVPWRSQEDAPTPFRVRQLAEDVANPYYQDIAKRAGIQKLNSANDMGQVYAYLDKQNQQQAPAPTPAPPAAEEPKAPPFNLNDWMAKGDGAAAPEEEQGSGKNFLQRFMEDMRANATPVYTPGGENTKASLYDKFAADYEKRSQERKDSFQLDPMAAAPATGARTGDDDPARGDQGAGQFPQQTAWRQDSRAQDRVARTFMGTEPESTRFAGGRAFSEGKGSRYGQLDDTYSRMLGRA